MKKHHFDIHPNSTCSLFLTICCILLIYAISGLQNDADADVALDFTITENEVTQNQVAHIRSGKVSIKRLAGNPNSDLLYDAQSDALFIVNHQTRDYYKIDRVTISKVASMSQTLGAIVESEQGVLSDLLEAVGIESNETAVKYELVETDFSYEFAQIGCRLFNVTKDNVLDTQFCMAGQKAMELPETDFQTLNSLYRLANEMVGKAGPLLDSLGVAIPSLGNQSLPGLPIYVRSVSYNTQTELHGIRQSEAALSEFTIPEGYTQAPIPFIG